MTTLRKRLLTAGLVASLAGCAAAPPLAPALPATPISLQVAPGMGCSLQSAGAVYLVVNVQHAENRVVLPRIADIIAAELRAATPAEVILLVDAGLECPPAAEWGDLCRACHVPIAGAPPSAVVVFCDVLEYDPYSPLRVGLSMRVRRAVDGLELVALQGTWVGTPPVTPQRPPFHWLRKKGPPRPNVDFAWTAEFEAEGATELVRHAAYQCVSSLQTAGGGPPQAFVPIQEPVPPAPPALPEIVSPLVPGSGPEAPPPLPVPPITGSGTSAPEEFRPSP